MDPNTMDLEQMYQDNLPPETKVLEDFLNDFKDKETNDDKVVEKANTNLQKHKKWLDNLLPEEGSDWRKISKLQF